MKRGRRRLRRNLHRAVNVEEQLVAAVNHALHLIAVGCAVFAGFEAGDAAVKIFFECFEAVRIGARCEILLKGGGGAVVEGDGLFVAGGILIGGRLAAGG